jgi:hypothetical protein
MTNDIAAIRANYHEINQTFMGTDNPRMILSNHFDVLDLCDEIEELRAEHDRLRSLWPKNGLDEDTDVKQLIANHRAWTKRANDEVSALRVQLEAARRDMA